jgi:hypothetical protein
MARYELLNNVDHKDLRVVTRFGPEFGDDVGMVAAFPTEFAELSKEYPIFFHRQPDTGVYRSVALLGFEQRENLFLADGRWTAHYLPGAVAKGPFLIGFQERGEHGELRREPVIHVDLAHARASTTEGEPVFLRHGGHSAYLEHIIRVLQGIHDGVEADQAMTAAFDRLGLIKSMDLDVRFDGESGVRVNGLFGIDRDRLAALDAHALHALHREGWLEGAFLILASTHNVRRLLAEKQRRLRQAAAAGRAA